LRCLILTFHCIRGGSAFNISRRIEGGCHSPVRRIDCLDDDSHRTPTITTTTPTPTTITTGSLRCSDDLYKNKGNIVLRFSYIPFFIPMTLLFHSLPQRNEYPSKLPEKELVRYPVCHQLLSWITPLIRPSIPFSRALGQRQAG
jgi:hypothetical protein